MWYDNSDRAQYKETKINLWRIRWSKKDRRWMVGYMKERAHDSYAFETVFVCDTKDEGIDYAVQHVCPQLPAIKSGSGANAGAQAGVRGRNGGELHRRLADRNTFYRSSAAMESKKSKIAKKLRRQQWQSE